ncbi:MAG: efflux RND transporter periplasmic adaptor subunit [Elusimicrobia bacterium]|nr:efflux RND transporter periplasmic adaptor subunit [Elusimicrobiota bacterium]
MMKMIKNKYFIIGAIVVLLLLVISISMCGKKNGNETKTAKAHKGLMVVTITSNGTIRSNNEANLAAAGSGKVEKIFVDENQAVDKGQVLLELSSYGQAEKDYKRLAALGEKGYVTSQQVELAKEQWENTFIKAPFYGTIAKKFVESGEMLISGTPAFLLADLNDMIVETNIDETDIGNVKVGQAAEVSLDAYKNVKLTGRVLFISRSSLEVKEKGITYQVKVKFYPVSGVTLRLGMTCDVNVKVAEKNDVLMIPYTAIGEEEGRNYVFTVEKNMLKKKFIVTGLENYDNTEILSGLNENETVIENNTSKLKDGQKVKIK